MNMNDEQQRLVTDNMKLVHFVVNKYYPTFNGNEDVSQVGMVGLCKAALAWNPEKTTFTTCACNYIRNEIRLYFRENLVEQQPLSLDYEYEGDMTLSDAIEGDTDVNSTIGFDEFLAEEPERTQLIIKLQSQGYTLTEIADVLGVPYQTVAQVKRNLKLKWERRCDVNSN
jgi:RNA polymerase sigma factor (sigma-70 family)